MRSLKNLVSFDDSEDYDDNYMRFHEGGLLKSKDKKEKLGQDDARSMRSQLSQSSIMDDTFKNDM